MKISSKPTPAWIAVIMAILLSMLNSGIALAQAAVVDTAAEATAETERAGPEQPERPTPPAEEEKKGASPGRPSTFDTAKKGIAEAASPLDFFKHNEALYRSKISEAKVKELAAYAESVQADREIDKK